MTYEKDLIQFRASVLMKAILNNSPITMELQNDYDFIMNYGSDILKQTVVSAIRLVKEIDKLPYFNERDKI